MQTDPHSLTQGEDYVHPVRDVAIGEVVYFMLATTLTDANWTITLLIPHVYNGVEHIEDDELHQWEVETQPSVLHDHPLFLKEEAKQAQIRKKRTAFVGPTNAWTPMAYSREFLKKQLQQMLTQVEEEETTSSSSGRPTGILQQLVNFFIRIMLYIATTFGMDTGKDKHPILKEATSQPTEEPASISEEEWILPTSEISITSNDGTSQPD
ncbi:unnamed protein product, partial [Allacma fusca]